MHTESHNIEQGTMLLFTCSWGHLCQNPSDFKNVTLVPEPKTKRRNGGDPND